MKKRFLPGTCISAALFAILVHARKVAFSNVPDRHFKRWQSGWKRTLRFKVKFCSRPHGQINENWKKKNNRTESPEVHLCAVPGLRDVVCVGEARSPGMRKAQGSGRTKPGGCGLCGSLGWRFARGSSRPLLLAHASKPPTQLNEG